MISRPASAAMLRSSSRRAAIEIRDARRERERRELESFVAGVLHEPAHLVKVPAFEQLVADGESHASYKRARGAGMRAAEGGGRIIYDMQPRMIQFDRVRTPKDLLQKIDRLFELPPAKSARSRILDAAERRAGVHGGGPLHGTRLDRVDPGLSVRFGAPAVRRDRRRASSSSSDASAR